MTSPVAHFHPVAIFGQAIGELRVAERVREPGAQRSGVVVAAVMRFDDLLLAGFQRPVEIGRDDDVVRNEAGGAERALAVPASD